MTVPSAFPTRLLETQGSNQHPRNYIFHTHITT
ncbi:hypothetical protein CsSME_00049999 [Camellia sinensis var. sinensis]